MDENAHMVFPIRKSGIGVVIQQHAGAFVRQRAAGGHLRREEVFFRRDMQRRGYAREAACAVRDWAFRNTPFNLICSYMLAPNLPSARTALSYGCRPVDAYEDETYGDTRVYAISRTEWEAIRR